MEYFGVRRLLLGCKLLILRAGDGDRTRDVQLGNMGRLNLKNNRVPWRLLSSIKTAVVFTFRIPVQLNGLQMGCTDCMYEPR